MRASNRRSLERSAPSGLRIIHITEAPLGGVLGCIQEIIPNHAVQPAIHSIFALVPEIQAPILRDISAPNVEVRSFRYRRGSLISLLRLAIKTVGLVREVKPDVVHVHSTIAGVVVRLSLLAVPGRPWIVYCPHSWIFCSPFKAAVRGFGAGLERVLSIVTDKIICVSEFEKQKAIAIGIPEGKCVVVQNGIAERPFVGDRRLNTTPSRLKVVFIGRFDRQKGFDTFLEVMSRVSDVADGLAVGGYFVNRAEELATPGNVQISGWLSRDELQVIYASADVLLMPSRADSSPLVAIEAMRSGLAVFASRIGGLPEIVVDGVTGRLFDPTDIEEVVGVIRSTSREKLLEYGLNGRDRFVHFFTAQRMSKELLNHYIRLTQSRPSSARPHANSRELGRSG